MRYRRTVGTATATLLGAALAACGGSPDPGSPYESRGAADGAVIVVDNTGTAISEMTIYLVADAGMRQRLGTVTLEARKTFTVKEASWGSTFRLLGDPVGSGELYSRTFQLVEGNVVEWDVDLNNVNYGGGGGR